MNKSFCWRLAILQSASNLAHTLIRARSANTIIYYTVIDLSLDLSLLFLMHQSLVARSTSLLLVRVFECVIIIIV